MSRSCLLRRLGIAALLLGGVAALWSIPYKRTIGSAVRAYHSESKVSPSDELLNQAFAHKRTVDSLDDLFIMNSANEYSEVGGLMTVDFDGRGPFLRFYTSKTLNERFADEMLSSQDIPEFVRRNEKYYRDITDVTPIILNECIKKRKSDVLLDMYRACSSNLCDLDVTLLYYEHIGAIEGRVAGDFHLHKTDSPSMRDKEVKWYVIVRTKPYSIYRTGEGLSHRIR